MKVLIVDDVDTNRKLLRITLEAEGMEVIEAPDGVIALQLLEKTKPDAIVSDVLMPNMDGFHFCIELRKHPEFSKLPFVFYTGTYTSKSDEDFAKKIGADGFFKKPSSVKAIRQTLMELASQRSRSAPVPDEAAIEPQVMKQYNELLIRRLEKKNKDLEVTRETLVVANEDLAEITKQLKYLVDNIDGVFFSFDAKNNRLIFISSGCETLYQLPRKNFLENPSLWKDLAHPDDKEIISSFELEVNEGYPVTTEYRIIRPSEEIRWVEARLKPSMDRFGKLERVDGIVTDTTERKKAEEAREQLERSFLKAQKMESIGNLTGSVAHDFNNSIMAILGFAELIRLTQKGNPKLLQYASEIIMVCEQAGNLTAQLLAFSRRQVLSPKVLSLNVTIAKISAMLQRLIGAEVSLHITLAPDLGMVRADPVKIEQVLMNLTVNARDAMPQGGNLTIETSNLEVDETFKAHVFDVQPGHYVMMAVSDTGQGMDSVTQSKIFEPFFTTKSEGKGTGLGLSTVYGIVKQSGGFIWVYSQLNEGTTFKILLPRVFEKDQHQETPIAIENLEGKGEIILVVDDNESVRVAVSAFLEVKGYKVLQAGSAKDAFEIASNTTEMIDLLLTDFVLPEIRGTEVAQRIKQIQPEIKILFMSGYSAEAVRLNGILEPGSAFISKPIQLSSLLKKIRELLERK